jgi:hypothetical protein
MDKAMLSEFPEDFTRSLLDFCDAPAPEPTFLASLEQSLTARQASILRTIPAKGKPFQNEWGHVAGWLARAKWQTAVLFLAVVLLAFLIAVGPQRVWAAVLGLFGYIPGIGFVQSTDTVLVLAEPVVIEREGVKVTVENAASDASSTRINLTVQGLAGIRKWVNENEDNQPHPPKTFVLPDGTALKLHGWSVQYDSSAVTIQLAFDPLPTNIHTVTLSFIEIPGVPSGFAPEGWTIPIQFKRGAGDDRIKPGIPAALSSLTDQDITLSLTGMSQSPTQTLLQVQLKSNDPRKRVSGIDWWSSLALFDQNGQKIPLTEALEMAVRESGQIALKTPPLIPGNRYTLRLIKPIIVIEQKYSQEQAAGFEMDLGPAPEVGQFWPLDETLTVAGRVIHVTEATLLPDLPKRFMLKFFLEAQDGTQGIMVGTPVRRSDVIGSSENKIYFSEVPTGKISVEATAVFYPITGNWSIEWMYPQ